MRGCGLLVALDLGRELAVELCQQALDAGLLLNAPRPNILRFMPALNVTWEEIDTMLMLLEQAVHNDEIV